MQTSCIKGRLLVQPTTKTNQKQLHTLGVPYNYYTRTTQHFIPTYQLPRVGSSMPKNYGDSGPDSTQDSPWMSSASSSSSGPGMTGYGGGAAIASG
jgi:hypothetical protein